mmetsp:Transcript_26695/g.45690  ORF Transcript_26695/g.45690 Transcript_26695/m.45690 type:complete len:428 (+) Transcript_26695:43-1326(+)|eukprot:CAMPEP_0206164132 /NCGR_PEP_ID=MMETSP1474-20131121/14488_1 /ASSEMBLY_ACC=CAM_ASM_001110 /TAXON_ID=97495 /ORGANISM="Imantonia sp., Strain RCC918" /LENGTH=427 /DNA_ID=CAMNT_0053566859 /DNA_START=40 /DNA_END=1323 /DNA_ORIENTATION=+
MTQTKRQKTEEPFPRRIIPVIGDSKVIVGRGLLTSIPAELTPANGFKASKFVVVSDSNVWPLYGEQLVGAFLALGFSVKHSAATELHRPPVEAADNGKLLLTYQVAAGEGSKCRETKAAIEDFMLEHRCNRDTVMIALGGGVVGDLIGYVAATFMRGVPVVQIPTSSTAMIDSSVGGKTAINVPAGKNLIGAFHQPVVVYADMDLLRTLPPRELVEGISEAIKMGVIRIPSLFDLLEAHPQRVMALDPELIEQVMYDSIRGKAEVVALDEREAGIRSTLNWGHTIGHAIEALKSPAYMHGECVAVGCVAETEVVMRLGIESQLDRPKIERITKCFASYNLPVHVPRGLELDSLMNKMALDKKNRGNTIKCTIVTDIGVSIAQPQPVPAEIMREVMRDSMAEGVAAGAEWTPHEGHSAQKAAGGMMAS